MRRRGIGSDIPGHRNKFEGPMSGPPCPVRITNERPKGTAQAPHHFNSWQLLRREEKAKGVVAPPTKVGGARAFGARDRAPWGQKEGSRQLRASRPRLGRPARPPILCTSAMHAGQQKIEISLDYSNIEYRTSCLWRWLTGRPTDAPPASTWVAAPEKNFRLRCPNSSSMRASHDE
jgi:hypothetical protein